MYVTETGCFLLLSTMRFVPGLYTEKHSMIIRVLELLASVMETACLLRCEDDVNEDVPPMLQQRV